MKGIDKMSLTKRRLEEQQEDEQKQADRLSLILDRSCLKIIEITNTITVNRQQLADTLDEVRRALSCLDSIDAGQPFDYEDADFLRRKMLRAFLNLEAMLINKES